MKKSKYLRGEGLALLIALVVGFVAFYVFLPPISLQSREFYFFAILLMNALAPAFDCFCEWLLPKMQPVNNETALDEGGNQQ